MPTMVLRLGAAMALILWMLTVAAPARADYEAGIRHYEAKRHLDAINEFTVLAERGHGGSEFMIGVMYFYGAGVPKDTGIAAVWFHKSALKGHPPAQLAFGSIHIRGVGVEQNLTDAYMWLMLAAQSNVPGLVTQATTLRDDAQKEMNAQQVEDARRRAREWRPRRAGLVTGG
jgi:TPR repeat protein